MGSRRTVECIKALRVVLSLTTGIFDVFLKENHYVGGGAKSWFGALAPCTNQERQNRFRARYAKVLLTHNGKPHFLFIKLFRAWGAIRPGANAPPPSRQSGISEKKLSGGAKEVFIFKLVFVMTF